ncbi:aliphatic sulfonate ABC transporter permease SsuC [Cupriavidus gilardii]|uniref:aliphatic sulfonate ABC transporter permease SsuC n=1 Tax=Cupriavidus gilardii TaxID=82541 RepID=UPI0009EEBD5F|nr:aliphatic sulfonate ABC transporter permease SsuC [Cupriavidus gilardii]
MSNSSKSGAALAADFHAGAPARALLPQGWGASALRRGLPWLVPALILLLWELASRSGWLSSRVLPEPLAVVAAFRTLALSGELWQHTAVSAWRALAGLAIGGGLGLLLGLLNGTFRSAETLLDSSLQMVRNIPALALIPLVILWFGIDEAAKLFLVAVGVFFPIYLNTFHGIRSVDKGLIEMARSYGLSGWALYWQVILPGALPSILVGLRFSLGLMWVLLIVAETISAQAGIGYLTMNAREFLQTDVVLVGILLYALLGKLADLLAKGLERWWLRWHPGYQGAEPPSATKA